MSLKNKIQNNQNEFSPMDAVIQIALRFLHNSFGVLGSQEFKFEDIRYEARSNAWKVILVRSIDNLNLRYELTIDLVRQRPARFRRLT